MKRFAPALALMVLSAPSFAQTLEERIESLELARDLNWIKWGGSLETRYDYIDQERNKSAAGFTPVVEGGNNNQFYRVWANLNMEAKPNDRMTFFGRLSMAKYMNVFGTQGSPTSALSSFSEGNTATNTSTLYLERAFMNYNITDSLIFTMGRLPTIDGPNKHIAMNQQLMGNYPTLAYSAILDGFAFTKSFALPDSAVLRAKAIYTPSQQINFNNTNTRAVDAAGEKVSAVEDGFYSGILEFEKSNGSFYKHNLSMFQYVRADRRLMGENNTATGGSTFSSSVNRFTFYTEFQGVAQSGFDIALQGMYSHLRSKGDLFANVPGAQGWMTDKSDDTQYGHATVVTVKYNLPLPALKNPKIGVEWFNSTKTAFVYDLANVNPINMYQSPDSDVYHLFWNQPFGDGLSMTVGYMYRDQKTTYPIGGLLGGEQKVDNIDQNIYASLLATF